MERAEKYGQAALDSACAAISTAQTGVRNQVLNSESYGIGQLVGAGVIGVGDARLALLGAAKLCGIDRHAAEATVESGLKGGMQTPRQLNGSSNYAPLPAQPAPQRQKSTEDRAREFYRAGVPIANTLAERYLREHRGIDGPLPQHFRFHPGIWHKEAAASLPAMLAPITRTDETAGRIGAVHVTFLDPSTGAKAQVSPAKKMFGSCKGGAIWLGEFAAHMLCAEGIEKGLACQAATGIPCAVGLSATLLPSIVWPRGTTGVTLCADPNGAGEAAIHKAAKAMAEDGIALDLLYPPLAGKDWDETPADYIRAAVAIAKPWSPPKARPKRERKPETASAGGSSGGAWTSGCRPLIQIAAGELARIVDEAEAYLIDAKVPFYRRGSRLVRPVIETVSASDERQTQIPRLAMVDDVYMRLALARHIQWEKFDGRVGDWVRADPSKDISSILNARYGDWGFPSVCGIIGAPTIRRDGSMIIEPGYDARTGLILINPPELPEIVEKPTREDALDAIALLNELLAEFPFVGPGSRAVALSALITPVVRAAMSAAPMHVTTAPQAGTGKSYIFDIAAAIALGQVCPVIAAGKTEEEMEKRLGAALMAGQPLISIDNVNGELGGDLLCQAIERPLITPRILGKSEIGQVQNRATFFATGNNLVLLDDMTRRAVICAMDSGEERPELRVFGTKPVHAVLAERGPYIAACLTIVRAYHFAGRPGRLAPLASFEDWSDMVRSALVWLGEDDPIVTMEKARDNDPTRVSFVGLVHAWAVEIGTGRNYEMTAAELIKAAGDGQAGVFRCPQLRECLHDIIPEKRLNSKSLGRWLVRQENKVSDGLKLRKMADSKNGHRFFLDDPTRRLL
jgi:putative DNA primase/helicase